VDQRGYPLFGMQAVEFTTELGDQPVVAIPEEIAARLPKAGPARVIILTGDDPQDGEWRNGGYEQFLRDDPAEDAIYDSYQ
jgi:hypothetical protein